jgi:DNA-binding CsgD family transcriptional regulator
VLRPDQLTERQRRVLDGLVAGKSNGVLARELGITVDGVKWHVSELLAVTMLTDRYELADWWRRERPRRYAPTLFALPAAGSATRIAAVAVLLIVIAVGVGAAVVTTRGGDGSSVVLPPRGGLVFAAGGSIYVVAADGTGLRELIPGRRGTPGLPPDERDTAYEAQAEWNSSPSFSPDATQLVFVRGFDIWIANADGSDARMLAQVSDIATPPAGAVSNASTGAQTVAWSPDGEHILYSTARIGGSGINQVWVMRPDGSDRRPVTGVEGAFLLPRWLDDERIVVHHDGEVVAYALSGTRESLGITAPGEHGMVVQQHPDGRWLTGSFLHDYPGTIRIGEGSRLIEIARGVSPVLSPDGGQVAYFLDGTGRLNIISIHDTLNLRSTEPRLVVETLPLGGPDEHHADRHCADPRPACSYRPPSVSWIP